MDDHFKIYEDDESAKLKSDLKKMLGNINSLVCKFLKVYDANKKLQDEIRSLMYEDPIFNNKKKVQIFNSLLKNSSDTVNTEEIEQNKSRSTMHQKRSEEMNKVKDFVQGTFLKALTSGSESVQESEKIKSEHNNNNKASYSNEVNNETQSNNILFAPKPSEDLIKMRANEAKKPIRKVISQDDDDDIQVEFLGKKQKKEKVDPTVTRSTIIFQSCYICKSKFNKSNTHQFYTNLCVTCGDFNYSFRELNMDLKGRIAVVTGGRVKIGYYIVLKLLNYGCKVISTTRFPKDALVKYMQEPNYESFKDNLIIYPIDFRIMESTEKFVKYLIDNFPHLDILINNAAQTVRRTTSYYKYLLAIESTPMDIEEENKIIKNDFVTNKSNNLLGDSDTSGITALTSFGKNNNRLLKMTNEKNLPLSVIASQIKTMNEKEGPKHTMTGADGQPIDFSEDKSSWNLELDEIPLQEFTEVQIINAWTPYYLCVKLKPLMEKSPFNDRYIVNVSSVEGIFSHFKRTTHPHTNMAKAALNMMTRTCGKYYKGFGIYMTSVDTGWVSPMNEFNHLFNKNNSKAFEQEYVNIPLDELDGAMRCIHPVIEGVMKKNYIYGYLLKDYKTTSW